MLSLAHVGSASPAAGHVTEAAAAGAGQPLSPAIRGALAELASAYAALADGGEASVGRASAHTSRARALAVSDRPTCSPHAQLIARLVETVADDALMGAALAVSLARPAGAAAR